MLTVRDVSELRSRVESWRGQNQRIVFVPTMGNLHAGHLALVRHARTLGDRVIVSIFVNPTQFAPGEDYDSYPRTPQDDAQALAAEQVDLVFAPDVDSVYPDGVKAAGAYPVPPVGHGLEDEFRPGFFAGVVSVVKRLFELVQPDWAVFGQKDYQQLAVIRAMISDLGLPIELASVATVREADGLALSSRNQYLSAEERAHAPLLYRTLCELAERLRQGDVDYAALERGAMHKLASVGFVPDYVSIRQAESLLPVTPGERNCVVLAAARLGRARLIDNVIVSDNT
jgi:pantoate--beta-alanine ligase